MKNRVPFTFLEVDNSFGADKNVMAGDSGDTCNGIPVSGLCICLVHGVKVRTTSADLYHNDQ